MKKKETDSQEILTEEPILEENLSNECNCENHCCCNEEDCNCSDDSCNCNTSDCNCEKSTAESECDQECHCHDQEIEQLQTKIKALEEAFIRNQAELQNYKRRKEEELERILKYKNEDIIKELLPIVDNFERAIKMDDHDLADEVSKFLEGFKIIYTNTINLLNKFEVSSIPTEGLEFDPNVHHAVMTEHDENKPEGVVLEVLQKGYMYKDRVVRPSMVKVNE